MIPLPSTRTTQDAESFRSPAPEIALREHAFRHLSSKKSDKYILAILKRSSAAPKDTVASVCVPLTFVCARYRWWNSLKWLVDNGYSLTCTGETQGSGRLFRHLANSDENFCPTRHYSNDNCSLYAIIRHGRVDIALKYSNWMTIVNTMSAYRCTPQKRYPSQIDVECVSTGPLAFALNASLPEDAQQITIKRDALKSAAAVGMPMFRAIYGAWIPGNHMECDIHYSSCRMAIEDGYTLFQRYLTDILLNVLSKDTITVITSYEDRHPNYVKCTCPLCWFKNCKNPFQMYPLKDVEHGCLVWS